LILFLFSFTPGSLPRKLQITRNDCSHDNNDNVKGLFGRKKMLNKIPVIWQLSVIKFESGTAIKGVNVWRLQEDKTYKLEIDTYN